MTLTWAVDSKKITSILYANGFDVDDSNELLPEGGGSITARRETGTRALLLRIDAGGRLQIGISEQLADDTAEPLVIGSVKLIATDSTIRRRTFRGIVGDLDQFNEIIKFFAGNESAAEPTPN